MQEREGVRRSYEQAAGHAQMGFGCSPGELDTQGWWIISAGGMFYL